MARQRVVNGIRIKLTVSMRLKLSTIELTWWKTAALRPPWQHKIMYYYVTFHRPQVSRWGGWVVRYWNSHPSKFVAEGKVFASWRGRGEEEREGEREWRIKLSKLIMIVISFGWSTQVHYSGTEIDQDRSFIGGNQSLAMDCRETSWHTHNCFPRRLNLPTKSGPWGNASAVDGSSLFD